MSEFNFNSQVCTDKVQSERLLALGLKKKTADMCYALDSVIAHPFIPSAIFQCIIDTDVENKTTLPAWSLHRLIEITSDFCDVDGEEGVWCCECRDLLGYRSVMTESWLIMWNKPSLYDNIIDCIEWLIKEGYFNKEYLEEKK